MMSRSVNAWMWRQGLAWLGVLAALWDLAIDRTIEHLPACPPDRWPAATPVPVSGACDIRIPFAGPGCGETRRCE